MSDVPTAPAPVEGSASAAPATPAAQEYRVKVNGKEKIVSAAEAQKYISLGLASTEKFTEAARMREEAEALTQAYKTAKPMDALVKAGYTRAEARRMLEDSLLEEHELSQRDPRDVELERYKKKDAEDAAAKAKKEAEETEKAQQVKVQAAMKALEHEIVTAAEAAGFPRDKAMLRAIAYEMQAAAEHGVELPASKAVEIVLKDYQENIAALLQNMKPDKLQSLLGEKLFASLAAQSVSNVKKAEAPFVKARPSNKDSAEPAGNKEAKVQDTEDFFRNLRRQR